MGRHTNCDIICTLLSSKKLKLLDVDFTGMDFFALLRGKEKSISVVYVCME